MLVCFLNFQRLLGGRTTSKKQEGTKWPEVLAGQSVVKILDRYRYGSLSLSLNNAVAALNEPF